MKKFILFLMAAALLHSSCAFADIKVGKGKVVICTGSEMVKAIEGLSDFSSITVNGSADIEFIQADAFKVVVKANSDVFNYLDYSVKEGVLNINTKDNVSIQAPTYDVVIQAPFIEKLTVNGAADIEMDGFYESEKDMAIEVNGAGDMEVKMLSVPNLSISINGAGDMEVKSLTVQSVSVSIDGAGDVDLAGTAGSAKFFISGAGEIDARDLRCDNVESSKSGLARIRL